MPLVFQVSDLGWRVPRLLGQGADPERVKGEPDLALDPVVLDALDQKVDDARPLARLEDIPDRIEESDGGRFRGGTAARRTLLADGLSQPWKL